MIGLSMGWIENSFSLTGRQRNSIILLLTILAVVIISSLCYRKMFVPDEQLDEPSRAGEVADRIDINSADWATLAVLPSIGEKRAKDIVAVREQRRIAHPNQLPFESIEDLDKQVRGIGPATITKLRPYLIFSSTRPATQKSDD